MDWLVWILLRRTSSILFNNKETYKELNKSFERTELWSYMTVTFRGVSQIVSSFLMKCLFGFSLMLQFNDEQHDRFHE